MAGTFALDSSSVGASIDTNATLTTINFLTGPNSSDPHDMFCLVDDTGGTVSATVFGFHPGLNGGFAPDANQNLMTYQVSFTNLVLQACPDGATFNITTV